MGFAVLHLEKAKGTDSGMSAHIERKIQPINADCSRSYLNKELINFPDGVENRTQAINYRLMTASIKRKIGSNQVRAIRVLLTGSHDDMKRIENEDLLDNWCYDSLQWLFSTFGEQNVVSAVLHMDEYTPHIHATIVPIVTGKRRKEKSDTERTRKKRKKDLNTIRLCADDVMTRSKLKSYQDIYASKMTKYGLSRGVDGSFAKHLSTSDYYRFLVNQSEGLESEIDVLKSQKDNLRVQLLKTKSEINTQKLKNVATDATIAITNSVASVFGGGKIKQLEIENKLLHKEIDRNKITINELEDRINVIRKEYRLKLEKEREENKRLESIISKAFRWFPNFSDFLQLEIKGLNIGLSAQQFTEMVRGNMIIFSGKLFSQQYRRWFKVEQQVISIAKNNGKFGICIGDKNVNQWFANMFEKLNIKSFIEEQRRKCSMKR